MKPFKHHLGCFLAAALLGLPWGGGLEAAQNCQALIDTRCESCHYKTRICQELGRKNRRAWKRTIQRMVRYGATLSTEEQKTLADCLAVARPGAAFVCTQK